MRGAPLCWLFVAGVLACVPGSAEHLRSPWDATAITPTDAPYNCPVPPAFARTLNVEGYYTDKQYSVIDPARLAAFNAASEGPTHLGPYATSAADAWLSEGSRAAAACVYSLLDAAAKADAWDGKMPQLNGVYLQNWMLSGTAIAYLKVRNSHMGTSDQDADIQKWFRLLAERVREYFDDAAHSNPAATLTTTTCTGPVLPLPPRASPTTTSTRFCGASKPIAWASMPFRPDGSLTAEMNRAAMAVHYQLYALGPLVMLAEIGCGEWARSVSGG